MRATMRSTAPLRLQRLQRLSARGLLVLGGIVVLLIAGLLGMHAMGGAGLGHGAAHASHAGHDAVAVVAEDHAALGAAAQAAPGHAVHASAGHPSHERATVATATAPIGTAGHDAAASAALASACDGTCQDDPAGMPSHEAMVACILALLAGLLVIVPPTALGLATAPALRGPVAIGPPAVLRALPPPSLIQLSISRT